MNDGAWRTWLAVLLFVTGTVFAPAAAADRCCEPAEDEPACEQACGCDAAVADDEAPGQEPATDEESEGDGPCTCPMACCGAAKAPATHRTSRASVPSFDGASQPTERLLSSLAPRDPAHDLLRPPIVLKRA